MWSHTLGATLALMTVLVPFALAEHEEGCVPEEADPATYNAIDTPDGRRFYVEERGNPLHTHPPVPGSGFLLGSGTFVWEEKNGVPGLQRPGSYNTLFTDCLPPEPLPCLIVDADPIQRVDLDDACGHGPDGQPQLL